MVERSATATLCRLPILKAIKFRELRTIGCAVDDKMNIGVELA